MRSIRPHVRIRVLPIAAALLVCAALARAAARPPHRSQPEREGYVDAGGGVRLFYRVLGAARDTIVVLHGGPGFSHAYLADDLEAVRQHFGLTRVTLLGHSWGAAVAALYAFRHPERVGALLLVGALPPTRAGLAQTFAAIGTRRDSAGTRRLRETRATWLAEPGDAAACRAYYTEWFQPFFPDPSMLPRTRGDFCAGTPEALRNKVASVDRFTFASLGDYDWRPALRNVTARTLVLQGTADVFPPSSVREWVAALPNARMLLLDGVSHFPYLEAPDRFGAAVDAFMSGGWPAGAFTAR